MRYFEDFLVGQATELGSVIVTEEEILSFAGQFDPQYFHVDRARASDSIFGGLVASGWHTASLFMRVFVDGLLGETASLGSPGIDELRWLRPVRPGDRLRGRVTVMECVPSRRRPERGVVRMRGELLNQQDEPVLRLDALSMIGRRPT